MRVGKLHLTVCALAVALAGCGGSKHRTPSSEPRVNVVQPGAPGEPSRTVAPGATPARIKATAADIEFMQGMIHHHQQAVVMTDWVPERTSNRSLRVMARRMGISQQNEIDVMRNWLKANGIDPANHSHRHTVMPGMLTTRQLERLKGASGSEFDELFLRYMTRHHRGALTMVQDLLAKGGGAEAEIGAFTRHVDADQAIEIQRMQELLKEL